jgi:hypothetical protein
MGKIFLLPLPVVVIAVAAGCGSEGRKQTALALPPRDLTLQAQTAEIEIASPVELQQLRPRRQTMRPSRRTTRPRPAAIVAEPVVTLAVADSAPQSASPAPIPANDRELLPGTTVTVIPASSGPSTTPEWTDEPPRTKGPGFVVVRGGGTCPPRGVRRGIGVAAFPRPHFR